MKGLLRIKTLLYISYKQHPLGKDPDSWLGIILPSPTNEFLLLPRSKPHKQRSSLWTSQEPHGPVSVFE